MVRISFILFPLLAPIALADALAEQPTTAASHSAAADSPVGPKVGDEAAIVLGVFSDADTAAVRHFKWSGKHTLLVFSSPE